MKLSADQLDTFNRDGVVALRGAFSTVDIDKLGAAIDCDMAHPGGNLVNHCNNPDAPGYFEDFWCWDRFPEFREFVYNSPAAGIAARLLNSAQVNLVMDNWFIREAGSTSKAPFHHDLAYFDFAGCMCVLWLPLEPVTKQNGIAWVKGSHLWNKLFMRVRFNDDFSLDNQIIDQSIEVNGQTYFTPPDVAANPGDYDLVQYDLNLGDSVFFDIACLHGALTDTVPDKTVRRYTLRMAGSDGRICYRGDWAAQERAIFEAAGYQNGDTLGGSMFPQLWPQT